MKRSATTDCGLSTEDFFRSGLQCALFTLDKRTRMTSNTAFSIWLMVCVFWSVSASARDRVEITTPYYTVVSVLSESETRKLIEEMRTFQAVVTVFTNISDLRPQVPLQIHLVDSADWKKYLQPTKNIAGYMSPRPLGFDAVMDAYSWSNASTILFHEYTHFILRNAYTGTYPIWFNEGFAEMLSTVKTDRGRVRIGEPPIETLNSLREFPRAHWTPLGELLRSQANPANDEGQQVHQVTGFYAQCWAVVHYMVFVHPNGAKSLHTYLTSRQQGVSVDDAFVSAFGESVDSIDAALKRYVQQRQFPIMTIDSSALVRPSLEPTKVTQLNELANALDFSRLLIRLRTRQDRALEYFDRLLKTQPRNAQALAGKGNVLEQIQAHPAADAAIEQALALAPNDPDVLEFAGNVHFIRFSRRGPLEEAQRAYAYYDRAMAMSGSAFELPEIVTRYANLALQLRADLNRALEQTTRTREHYPKAPDLALTHANLLTAVNRTADARDALQVAAQYGSDSVRAYAKKRLASMP
jgi:tetratricopeptide (TPR) repeat protein